MILRRCLANSICSYNEFCGTGLAGCFYYIRSTRLHQTNTVYLRKLLLDQNFRFHNSYFHQPARLRSIGARSGCDTTVHLAGYDIRYPKAFLLLLTSTAEMLMGFVFLPSQDLNGFLQMKPLKWTGLMFAH